MEIQIPRAVYDKIMHWINKSDDEVSGFGKVTYWKDTGVLQVHDAYLLKQKNGAAHTDIDGQSLAKLMYTSREEQGELKWWWHSHVNMAVFWSGTDTATIKELASQGWMSATVFNKKNEMRTALGYKVDAGEFGTEVVIKDELPTFIMPEYDETVTSTWDKEYDDNVEKKQVYTWPPSTYGTNHGPREGSYVYDATSTKESAGIGKGWNESDESYYSMHGWIGAGAWEESRYLGISYREYMSILLNADYGTTGNSKLNSIDERLTEAVDKGLLKIKDYI